MERVTLDGQHVVDREFYYLMDSFLVRSCIYQKVSESHARDDLHLEALHFLSEQYSFLRGDNKFLKFSLLQLFFNESLSRHKVITIFRKQMMPEI